MLADIARQYADPELRRQNLYDPPIDMDQIRRLTDPTGGYAQLIPTSEALSPSVIRIVDDVSEQYLLGFEPANPGDGRRHKLTISVRDTHMTVRARSEYTER